MYIAPLPEDLKASSDVQAILSQNCLGMAQEARLQSVDWGFEVTDISQLVAIQHSIADAVAPFRAVQSTARLLKDHPLYTLDDAPHSLSRNVCTLSPTTVATHQHDRISAPDPCGKHPAV